MNDDYDFGSNFDLGSFDDMAAVDFGNLDLGGFEDMDLGGLDLGGLEGLDLSGLEGMDFNSIDLGDLNFEGGGGSLDALLGGAGADTNLDFGSNFDLGSFEDLSAADMMAEGVGDFDQAAPSSSRQRDRSLPY